METYIIIGIIAVVVVAIGVYSILRNKKINENGIEADAVVSRIDTDTQTDADGSVSTNETYYVDYQNAEGEIVTAKLGKKNNRKKKQLVRIGCAALALAMTVGAVPFLMSHAAEGEAVTPIDIAAKNDVVSPADASARSITGTAEPNQYMTGIVKSGSCGDGVTYTIDSEGTMVISGSGVIADKAFYMRGDFSRVVFADDSNITGIGKLAFYQCTSLKSVDIPEGVTTIGEEAFSLSALKNVTFPSTMKTIGYRAFLHCKSLTSLNLPDSLTTIGNDSFIGCTGLTSVTIPGSVTKLGDGAFMNCKGLTSLTIEDGVPAIGNTAFQHCESLTSVTIPGSVETIDYDAFRSCLNMESVTISDGVKNIRNGAFWNCSRLTSLTIADSVTTIERDAFRQCPGLTSVIIPDSVTSIERNAFRQCPGLTSVIIPDSVTSIGTNVLGECENLTSVTIPCGLTVGETPSVTLDKNRKATDYFTNATVILSHNWEVSSTTATCTQSGIENLKCSVCDEDGTRDADALGHRWGEWEVTKKPTDTEAGVETCTCQNDASHTQTRGVKYAFTSDAYQWTAGSKDGMTVIVKNVAEDGDDTTTFDRFRNVYVDDVALTKDKDYTAEPGSVKITLSADYLQSRGTGVHMIRIELTVASLEHPFTVVKPYSGPSSPATGESGMMTTFCMALMLIASYGVVFARKRKQTEQA